jgi:general secretion pathway protein G
MKAYRNRAHKGFTLVEILIVVIILGILAAIVIPQFTNASQDARKNSLVSQLQTIRSQTELYKLQHLDQNPPGLDTLGSTAAAVAWAEMTVKTDADHTININGNFGPYLQAAPVNSISADPTTGADVLVVAADVTPGGPSGAAAGEGWVYNRLNGKMWACSRLGGFVYNEGDPSDPNNDN